MRWLLILIALSLAGCADSPPVADEADDGEPSEQETPFAITFSRNEGNDRLIVASVSSGSDWQDLRIRVSECTGDDTIYTGSSQIINSEASSSGYDISGSDCGAGSWQDIAWTESPIVAGEYIEFCADDGFDLQAPSSVEVEIMNDVQLVAQFTFSSVASC